MTADFDFSELNKLAADLGDVPEHLRPNVRKAVQVTAHHIRDDWRDKARRTGLGPYAKDVTYETSENSHGVEAEIGPTPGDAGSLGIVEDAGGDVKSAPQHAARAAVRDNEEDFIRGILMAGVEALEG